MNKFQNKAVIYRIVSKDKNDKNTYIGSTTRYEERKEQHKEDCISHWKKHVYNLKVYSHIRKNGGFSNFKFEKIEKYKCENRKELNLREGYYQKLEKSTLNVQVAGRTKAEYRKDNAENIKRTNIEYNAKHKAKIEFKHTCECGVQYMARHELQHKRTQKHLRIVAENNA